MGYYSKFKLTIEPTNSDVNCLEVIKARFRDIVWYTFDDISENVLLLSDRCNGGFGAKWYDYVKHMALLSNEYLYTLFTLDKVGEEWNDVYRWYFRGGMGYCPERINTTKKLNPYYGWHEEDYLNLEIEDDFSPYFETFDETKLER